MNPTNVVIAGGGVGAVETLLALRDLAQDRVRLTLVTSAQDLVYRPLAVGEPFLAAHAERYPLAKIAGDAGADLVRGAVTGVSAEKHELVLDDGTRLPYDKLVLALGAVRENRYRHATTFGEDDTYEDIHGMLADAEQGYLRRIAFVASVGPGWRLPLYELALMTAKDVAAMGIDDLEIVFITPEERPLDIFGTHASEAVAALLAKAGIEFIGSSQPAVGHGEIRIRPGGRRIAVDRVVTLPHLAGPRLEGLPDSHDDGFVAIDEHARVVGVEDVYAVGDMTAFPVKQGGIASQQADAAATAIAAAAGAAVEPRPFRPVLRGMLLLGRHNHLYLRHHPAGGSSGTSTAMCGPGGIFSASAWSRS